MSLKNFIFSKVFLKHLAYAIALAIGLIIVTLLWLNIYTRHGQARPVPNFKGLSIEQVDQVAKKAKVKYTVIDSVYTNTVSKGAVVEQNPVPGFKIKKWRNISLIVNATKPEMVAMPDLIDLPLRQAATIIGNSGLEIGSLIYKPDLSIDVVLNQQYNGRDIAPNPPIAKGSDINLVLGKGLSEKRVSVPNLLGLSYDNARNRIISASLNVGTCVFDKTVRSAQDTLMAFVYQQNPSSGKNEVMQLGSAVYIWLTTDSTKLPARRASSTIQYEPEFFDPEDLISDDSLFMSIF